MSIMIDQQIRFSDAELQEFKELILFIHEI